ncbi:hypothetical protein Q5762_03375 [Streptomyces sp. P9(2023)]|uniref:hypothetical protein n=1 Tax=Streptomyces sp. P9(2023) TaxID=3064394 RepID=UPI0028F44846|nr:hypothetical protein [Streptomyces sp. P9(2023)]MDT9687396.1 hypothetical protein [Streptomyces sp. P9(2023)]
MITLRHVEWDRGRSERRGGLVVLVTTALIALLFSVCGHGGHHRIATPEATPPMTTHATHATVMVGCSKGGTECGHGHDEHLAAPAQERWTPQPLTELLDTSEPSAAASKMSADPSTVVSRRGESGRDVLSRVCVIRT